MRNTIRAVGHAAALGLVWLLLTGGARAQGVEYIKANYTKHEHQVAMRDGVKLFTAVYVPRTPRGATPSC